MRFCARRPRRGLWHPRLSHAAGAMLPGVLLMPAGCITASGVSLTAVADPEAPASIPDTTGPIQVNFGSHFCGWHGTFRFRRLS